MNVYLKYNLHALRKAIVAEQMQKLNIPYTLVGTGELVLKNEISEDQRKQLKLELGRYGIEILEDHGTCLVQRIWYSALKMRLPKWSAMKMQGGISFRPTFRKS